jgi:hypothetical protein
VNTSIVQSTQPQPTQAARNQPGQAIPIDPILNAQFNQQAQLESESPSLQDQLSQTVGNQLVSLAQALKCGDTAPLREYLGVMSRFHRYSLHNQLLIFTQYPQATHVAGIKTWNQLGRKVKKGERSIRILAPILRKIEEDGEEKEVLVGFRGAYVFDLEQTFGKDLPQAPEVAKVDGTISATELQTYIAKCPYQVHFAPLAEKHYGCTDGKSIFINQAHAPADQLCSLFHEWVHVLYHFDGPPIPKAIKELHAEATAYVLCQMLGLEARLASAEYLLMYDLTPALLMGVLKEASKAVGEIGRVLDLV